MLELLKSLVFAVIMVPVVMAIILGAIYGLGEVFNVFSNIGHRRDQPKKQQWFPPKRPASPGVLLSSLFLSRRYLLQRSLSLRINGYDLALGTPAICRYICLYITIHTGASNGTFMGTPFRRGNADSLTRWRMKEKSRSLRRRR